MLWGRVRTICNQPAGNDCGATASNHNKLTMKRRGSILVLSSVFLVVILAFAAFSIDTGYMLVIKAELQSAADGAALASVIDPDERPLRFIVQVQDITERKNASMQ